MALLNHGNLHIQKRAFWAFTAAASLSVAGIGVHSAVQNAERSAQNAPISAPIAPPFVETTTVVPAPVEPTPVTAAPTRQELDQTLASLNRLDDAYFRNNEVYVTDDGARVRVEFNAYGSSCRTDGSLANEGQYRGTSTSISYDVIIENNNAMRPLCANHRNGRLGTVEAGEWRRWR